MSMTMQRCSSMAGFFVALVGVPVCSLAFPSAPPKIPVGPEDPELPYIREAVARHREASGLRKAGKQKQAQDAYRRASDAYRKYMERFPASKNAHEMRYSWASTLHYSEQHRKAAAEFRRVRDNRNDARFRIEAARGVASSLAVVVWKTKSSSDYKQWQEAFDRWAELRKAAMRKMVEQKKLSGISGSGWRIP